MQFQSYKQWLKYNFIKSVESGFQISRCLSRFKLHCKRIQSISSMKRSFYNRTHDFLLLPTFRADLFSRSSVRPIYLFAHRINVVIRFTNLFVALRFFSARLNDQLFRRWARCFVDLKVKAIRYIKLQIDGGGLKLYLGNDPWIKGTNYWKGNKLKRGQWSSILKIK